MNTTTPSRCKIVLDWLDARTGVRSALQQCAGRTVTGCPWLNHLWPSLIVFLFVVQVLTGLVLWLHYSPSATSAWESVYYVQHEVAGGWLVRGVHHFAAQVMVALTVLYVIQLVVLGSYRRPREFVFWAALGLALAALGMCLTGDLLRWDQNGFSATKTRVSFLMLLPNIGGYLFKLAAGGPAFGNLTLTRFFTLHVAVIGGGFLVLLLLHGWFSRRAQQAEAASQAGVTHYWPQQFCRNSIGWLVVMGVILLLVCQRGLTGDQAGQRASDYLGVDLGAPADTDPAAAYAAARPEWSFRGVYHFAHLFSGNAQIIPIFVVPNMILCYLLAMPFIGVKSPGHLLNIAVILFLAVANAVLSWESYRADAGDQDFQTALQQGTRSGERASELARGQGIPAVGALALLRTDPLLQGPNLFGQQCAACHAFSPPEEKALAPEAPSAPELYHFASRAWLTAFLAPQQITSSKFYGDTRFASGLMVKYVESHFRKLPEAKQQAIIAALSAEAQLKSQAEADVKDQALIDQGRGWMASEGCTRCHRFRDQGLPGHAPDLTGYGSREWLVGVIADPGHGHFYGLRNDRMPVYVEAADQPAKNRLSAVQLDVLASWLRGEWFEPQPAGEQAQPAIATGPAGMTALVSLGKWEARRTSPAAAPTDPRGQALATLALAQCVLCHDYSDGAGNGSVARQPTGPTLFRFASAEWIRGILDREQVAGPRYFGSNPKFKGGEMAKFVRSELKGLISDNDNGKANFDKLVAALAAESQKDGPSAEMDEDTQALFTDFNCANCHKFYDEGELGSAPDLTGYGSRQWLVEIIRNPEHERFYPKSNDGMPSYFKSTDKPATNLLTKEQIQQLADLLQGKFDPAEKPVEKPVEQAADKPAEKLADQPTEKSAETLAEKPAGKPEEKAAQKPVEKPADSAVEKAAEKAVEKPTEPPPEKPAN